jgi:ribosomal protein S12 methylthiotransferase accessory factor
MTDADVAVEERKVCVDGTHRTCLPEETFSRIEPVFAEVGITRIADITWLDEIGIPVYQAIRPNSWSLSVSQGKGLTADLAKVSAAMESIEFWHAEQMPPGERVGSPRELERELDYRVDELVLQPRSALNPDSRLEWSRATVIRTGAPTWLPTDPLTMDWRVAQDWCVPLFLRSTNGLASGNTLTEAVLHGLYEVVERDALAGRHEESVRTLALDTVTGPARSLLDQMRHADVDVRVTVLSSPVGLPCFRADVWSESVPLVFDGSGCHLDREVALCRALTEAAQCRLTLIAGTRDDIADAHYTRAEAAGSRGRSGVLGPDGDTRWIAYQDVHTVRQPDLAADLRMTVDRVRAATGRDPMFVDHTRPDLDVPVAHVVCPGLRFDPQHG